MMLSEMEIKAWAQAMYPPYRMKCATLLWVINEVKIIVGIHQCLSSCERLSWKFTDVDIIKTPNAGDIIIGV